MKHYRKEIVVFILVCQANKKWLKKFSSNSQKFRNEDEKETKNKKASQFNCKGCLTNYDSTKENG